MKVALYARVSTKDKGQSTDNQLPEVRTFAEQYGNRKGVSFDTTPARPVSV